MKTKLGISVGLLAAITYWCGVLGGYVSVLILVGYVLLREEDSWLRKSVVKALLIMVIFDVLIALINFVPDIFSWISTLIATFKGMVSFGTLYNFISLFTQILEMIRKAALLVLGALALKQMTINLPVVDDFASGKE